MQHPLDRLTDLRRQEREFHRHENQAHNRQSLKQATMRQLVLRRRRRFWSRLLASWAQDWRPNRYATA